MGTPQSIPKKSFFTLARGDFCCLQTRPLMDIRFCTKILHWYSEIIILHLLGGVLCVFAFINFNFVLQSKIYKRKMHISWQYSSLNFHKHTHVTTTSHQETGSSLPWLPKAILIITINRGQPLSWLLTPQVSTACFCKYTDAVHRLSLVCALPLFIFYSTLCSEDSSVLSAAVAHLFWGLYSIPVDEYITYITYISHSHCEYSSWFIHSIAAKHLGAF